MLVFVGSNSSKSINVQLTKAVLKELNIQNEYVDLKALDIPLFSEDLEHEIKAPKGILFLKEQIEAKEHVFIATNEHNSNLSAFFKNILDWLSRSDVKFLKDKKVFILSASEGRRGGLGANEKLQGLVRQFGCEVFESFTFPSFSQNFDKELQQVTNEEFLTEIQQKLNVIQNS